MDALRTMDSRSCSHRLRIVEGGGVLMPFHWNTRTWAAQSGCRGDGLSTGGGRVDEENVGFINTIILRPAEGGVLDESSPMLLGMHAKRKGCRRGTERLKYCCGSEYVLILPKSIMLHQKLNLKGYLNWIYCDKKGNIITHL